MTVRDHVGVCILFCTAVVQSAFQITFACYKECEQCLGTSRGHTSMTVWLANQPIESNKVELQMTSKLIWQDKLSDASGP